MISAETTIKPCVSDILQDIGWAVIEPGKVNGFIEHAYITTTDGLFMDIQFGFKVNIKLHFPKKVSPRFFICEF